MTIAHRSTLVVHGRQFVARGQVAFLPVRGLRDEARQERVVDRERLVHSVTAVDVARFVVAAMREEEHVVAELAEGFAHLHDLHRMRIDRRDWPPRKIDDLHRP